MNKNISLTAIHTFTVVSQTLSFTQAGKLLHITPSAVSHQMKQLESQLGVQLFHRKPQGVQLTAAGKTLQQHANSGMSQIQHGISQSQFSSQKDKLVIAVIPSLAQQWLIPRLASFSVKYPTIELDIVALDRLADFNTEQFDGHIHFGSGDYFGLKALWLANETVYPIYHPALIDDHQTQDLSSLIQHHQLLFYKAGIEDEPGGISWHDWLNHYSIERPSQLNKMSFSHVALAITAAKKQLGIALGWHHLVIDDVNQGQLISLDKFAMTTPFSYYLVAPSCAWENSNFRLFANWLTKQMT